MEGQGDDRKTRTENSSTEEQSHTPSQDYAAEGGEQTETVSSSIIEQSTFEQVQDESQSTSETTAEDPTTVTTDNTEKDSEHTEEVPPTEYKESNGSSDSQSEAFEVLKMPEEGSDSAQGERTAVEETEEDDGGYMDILGNGNLRKKVLTKGSGRESRPTNGDYVTLKSEGCLDDGTVLDKHDSISFIMGDGDTIQAWDLAVSLMELGEKCELITAAKYAYGDVGREPDVPPNATITYTLELLEKETSPLISSLAVHERITKGEAKRERGNYLFTRKDYNGAINSYSKGLSILESPGSNTGADVSDLQELLESKIKCYNNLAACQLKIDAHDAAIRSCECVLKTQPDNVKALYRIGKAYVTKGDAELALPYLKRALKIDPSSKILHAELSKVMKKLKSDTDSERKMYQRMMGTSPGSSKKPKPASWWKVPLIFGSVMAGVVSVGLAVAYRYNLH